MNANHIFTGKRQGEALSLLACPDCRAVVSKENDAAPSMRCTRCARMFRVTPENILCMLPAHSKELPAVYQDPDYLTYRALFEKEDAAQVYYSNRNRILHLVHHSAHRSTHALYAEQQQEGWTIDVGCGTGDHYPYFADISRVIGVDSSLGSLKALRRSYPHALLIQADAYALPFREGAFSNAFSIYNLEHLYFLDDALLEVQRILARDGKFFVGLPTEGGFAWSLGRKISTQRIYSKQYGIDYAKVMRIEHCNTARRVMDACSKYFSLRQKKFFPFPFLPLVGPNLTISLAYAKR